MLAQVAKRAVRRQMESLPRRLDAMAAEQDKMHVVMLAERKRQGELEERHAEYVRNIPWDIKLAMRVDGIITRPRYSIRKMLSGAVRFYPDIRSFIVAMTGGIASVDVYKKRQAVCDSCEFRRTAGRHSYCGACNCSRWPLSRLAVKNRLRKHVCPQGKHDE